MRSTTWRKQAVRIVRQGWGAVFTTAQCTGLADGMRVMCTSEARCGGAPRKNRQISPAVSPDSPAGFGMVVVGEHAAVVLQRSPRPQNQRNGRKRSSEMPKAVRNLPNSTCSFWLAIGQGRINQVDQHAHLFARRSAWLLAGRFPPSSCGGISARNPAAPDFARPRQSCRGCHPGRPARWSRWPISSLSISPSADIMYNSEVAKARCGSFFRRCRS